MLLAIALLAVSISAFAPRAQRCACGVPGCMGPCADGPPYAPQWVAKDAEPAAQWAAFWQRSA